MKAFSRVRNLPTPSVQRLPVYLRLLKEARNRGDDVVSCTRIAEEFGQLSVQVRKDLAITGVSGRPKVGYRVDELIEAIERFLGWDVKTTAFLVGVGNLGRALLNYEGFVEHGLDVVAAFDANPALFGQEINGRVVRPLDQIESTAAQLREEGRIVEMGIVTVPARAAQPVADKLVGVGVRAIWNYAPVRLDLPSDVVYEEVKLSASFAVLTNRLRRNDVAERV
ncbi:MAG: redox-sensing transcriptional repressor Rex [Thermoguttaceae bacterium]|nr:redox-sensing transcriptional repressor Rex [Thermoguttaceae bacterium]